MRPDQTKPGSCLKEPLQLQSEVSCTLHPLSDSESVIQSFVEKEVEIGIYFALSFLLCYLQLNLCPPSLSQGLAGRLVPMTNTCQVLNFYSAPLSHSLSFSPSLSPSPTHTHPAVFLSLVPRSLHSLYIHPFVHGKLTPTFQERKGAGFTQTKGKTFQHTEQTETLQRTEKKIGLIQREN